MYNYDDEPKPLTTQFTAALESELTRAGIAFTRAALDATRCELSTLGATYGVAYFVSAENVFISDTPERELERSFSCLQSELLDDEFRQTPRKDLYLFVVGDAACLDPERFGALRNKLEFDLNYARKVFCKPSQLLQWLRLPFPQLAGSLRANASPSLTAVPDRIFRDEQPPQETHVFDAHALTRELDADNGHSLPAFLTSSSPSAHCAAA